MGGATIGQLFILRSFEAARQNIATLRREIVALWFSAMLAALLVTYFVARRIMSPVAELDRAAAEIARRNYGYRVDVRSGDEIGRLAHTFNGMCESIQSAREELTRQERISTIGRLSTSIVHDLTQPFGRDLRRRRNAVRFHLPMPQVKRLATNIYRASRGIQDMLQQLLNVSPGRNGVAEICAVREVVAAAWSGIEVRRRGAQSHPDQRHSRGPRMSHGARPHGACLLNLFENAVEVMRGGGSVHIRAHADEAQHPDRSERYRPRHPPRSPRPPVPAVRDIRKKERLGPGLGVFAPDAARPRRRPVGKRRRPRRRIPHAPAERTPGNPRNRVSLERDLRRGRRAKSRIIHVLRSRWVRFVTPKGARMAQVKIPNGPRQLRDPSLDSLLQDPHCLLVDQVGRIWIGAGDEFVLCREGDQWRRFGMPRHLATHYISALAEEPDGTVWAGSAGEGLFQFKSGKLVAINASSGLSDNLVETLLMDREGKLWVGTHGGLNRISPRNLSVLSHNEGLGYGSVQGLAEVQPGIIWATVPNEGVYCWDGQKFRRLILDGLSWQQNPRVSALLLTRDGSCWVVGAGGLFQFKNPKAAEAEGGLPVLTNLSISALGQDFKGGVWAGTREGELWHLSNGKWQAQTNCPRGHAITAIMPDVDGALWIGTEGDGLYRFDERASVQCEKVSGLPSGWIRTLCLDSQRTLWIGTAGGGLSRLQDGHIATFTMREGLPDNTISQIFEDDDGNLWLGGNRGIARVKKRDFDDLVAHKILAVYPLVYSRADGMLSEECSGGFSPAGLRSKDGLLWFPTLKGIVVIDPHHAVSSPAPAVVLEQTLVDGVPELPVLDRDDDRANTKLETVVSPKKSLNLAPGKHVLEFRYTGLSFDTPDRVRFRYRLEGLDPDWVEAGTRRVAFYSFVPPGTYRFQVIACNGDGIWNDNGASLSVVVRRHYWQSWWFIGVLSLGMIVVVTGSVRVVEKRKLQLHLKRLEQERVLERERTRIAQDLHDIMGAKLCRISFLSEHARRSEVITIEHQDEMRSISDDSREVLQSLDEMVWAVNPQNDTLDHLISYIGQYAQEYFRKTGIECDLKIPERVPFRPISSQSRHHLFLAVQEALTNILKHSAATRASVTMTCHSTKFEIKISDNGIGFDPVSSESDSPSAAAGFCNGLGNMRRRLAELSGGCVFESRPGHGTTIQFVLFLDNPIK